jgi:hypothetical protein
MQFKMFRISCIGALLFSSLAFAQEPPSAPVPKRELANCMTRMMTARRTLSYNDAAKGCKEQLQGHKLQAASHEPPKTLGGT